MAESSHNAVEAENDLPKELRRGYHRPDFVSSSDVYRLGRIFHRLPKVASRRWSYGQLGSSFDFPQLCDSLATNARHFLHRFLVGVQKGFTRFEIVIQESLQ
jgi:hypothetical protein